MKIVFFGTPDYVIPVVEKLHKRFKTKKGSPIVAVVTQPPKPSGRKKQLEYSPVDTWAHKRKIPIYFSAEKLAKDNISAEVGVLASYGQIIPISIIDLFPNGILNIHPSLLPSFRGSSPVQATIISGKQAGSTIIQIDTKLDHGPIVSQFEEDFLDNDTTQTLRNRIFERSTEVLSDLLEPYIRGKIKLQPQQHEKATFTRQIKREDAFIPPKYLKVFTTGFVPVKSPTQIQVPYLSKWEIPFIKDYKIKPTPLLIERFIRAMQPWPQAWTTVKLRKSDETIKRLKILKAHLSPQKPFKLKLDIVQLEGKKPVIWQQFNEGYQEFVFAE